MAGTWRKSSQRRAFPARRLPCEPDHPSSLNRRRFLAASGVAAVGAPVAAVALTGWKRGEPAPSTLPARRLPLPPDGTIRTAVAIGDGFNVIDVAGPWEVLQDAAVGGSAGSFELFTVSSSTDPVIGSGGLTVMPAYSYENAPQPHVVVIPAHNATTETGAWLRRVAGGADLLMSVCTGAFVLAETGLLDGRTATTHHDFWDDFEAQFPAIDLVRDQRFVEHEHVATAGGLTSGIDLALRVVERYLGPQTAGATARYMEHTPA
jgi:transcriptional regulator GlxA family with amidase domain